MSRIHWTYEMMVEPHGIWKPRRSEDGLLISPIEQLDDLDSPQEFLIGMKFTDKIEIYIDNDGTWYERRGYDKILRKTKFLSERLRQDAERCMWHMILKKRYWCW